jgi:pyruvyltransferase
MTEPLRAFWCRFPSRPNFGDALTPWLIRRIAGRGPAFARPHDPRPKYFVAGSILEYAGPACIVWGAGILSRDDPVSPAALLLAVRGPLSRGRARACGAVCPEIYGDPALLLPRLYAPQALARKRTGREQVGLVAHFSDFPGIAWPQHPSLRIIDIQSGIEAVIDAIAACDRIVSTSLHGLIVAYAYGIPAVWGKFRDLPNGDDVKFHDFYLSIGVDPPPSPRMLACDRPGPAVFAEFEAPRGAGIDLEPLWQCCPFKETP